MSNRIEEESKDLDNKNHKVLENMSDADNLINPDEKLIANDETVSGIKGDSEIKEKELKDEEQTDDEQIEVPEDYESIDPGSEIIIKDYLDPSILDVREISEDEIEKFSEGKGSDQLSKKYLESFSDIRQQQVVSGSVVNITDRDILIDIGFKAEGVVSRSEFSQLPEIGEKVDVFIRTFEDRRGNLLLSKEKADFQKRWQEIRDCFDEEKLITGVITRRIKGGMVVDLGVVQAFLPGSQIDVKPVTNFDDYLGVESEFKIVKFNELRQNVVISRKAILEGDLKEKRQDVLAQMEVGMILDGIVKNITDFGAFIDLGGIDGLLHITDITWGRINHPTDRLELGETVKVKVIDFDVEKIRVSLGLKQLQDDPWQNIIEKYPENSIVDGKIVSLMNYGVFVEIQEGVEGLIHISEMSWVKHIKHPSDIFKTGDTVTAKILNIDIKDKKISMGIKQLQDNPWDDIDSKFFVGKDYNGIVRNLTQFGAFVELDEGIDGLVHISDMSWTKLIRHPKDIINIGDKVEVRVLEVSIDEKRLALGMKQLIDNPWEKIRDKYSSGKLVKGVVLKVLEKGIIFNLDNDVEGIVPIKQINKDDINNYKDGESYEVIVQEVDEDAKKIILMLDNMSGNLSKNEDISKIDLDIEEKSENVSSEDEGGKVTAEDDIEEVSSSEDNGGKVSAKDAIEEVSSEDDGGKVSAEDDIEEVSSEDDGGKVSAEDDIEEVSSDEDDGGKVSAEDDIVEVSSDEDDGGKVSAEDDGEEKSSSKSK